MQVIIFYQPTDSVELCIFDLHDEALWKAMSEDAILSVCEDGSSPVWPSLPPLCASTLDPGLISNDLELQLRMLVVDYRQVSKHCRDFTYKAA